MDDTTKPSPEGPSDDAADSNSVEEDDSNNSVALGIVFASVGFTLVMTLDTPWAGAPMLVLGIYFFGKSFMDQRKKRRGADPAGEV